MSLVGSLEDLGLGDILQIVHLSGKSGVLALRSAVGEGQIVFERGLMRSATTRDLPQDLRELLVRSRKLDADALADAVREARRAEQPLGRVIVERGLLSGEALEDLRAQHASDAVLEMFRWREGEFSFEVRDCESAASELTLAQGMNPQFLALEGTRERDEQGLDDDTDETTATVSAAPLSADDDPFADVADIPANAAPAVAMLEVTAEEGVLAAEEATEPEPPPQLDPAQERAASETKAPTPIARPAQPPPIIAIDPSLGVLEWIKAALAGYPRIHTFQHTELAIQRVRQYLLRRELPMVLIAADAPPDPVSGARDVYDVSARLRRQAPRLPIVVVSATGSRPPARRRGGAAPSAFAERPKDGALSDSRRSSERLESAAALRAVVDRLADAKPPAPAPAEKPSASSPAASELARLRDASARMRERARQGEVLPNVLAFAAQSFARVALFMVRDEQIVGMAQLGLAKAGGPDDAALREVALPARESSWVRRALDTGEPVRGRPIDDGDHRLCVMLGNEIPSEAFIAPLESANRVVALLYADNLPSRDLLPDTGALEVVLHEAGLALDRTLLERALAEAAADPAAS
ncbi:MAG TPA: DUF4388 domain-containing protein [Myxococcota bacterium]|nr:DUF4388 domain-containing protein [Myxococcota bacterium]